MAAKGERLNCDPGLLLLVFLSFPIVTTHKIEEHV
jgi:hypothetical protein